MYGTDLVKSFDKSCDKKQKTPFLNVPRVDFSFFHVFTTNILVRLYLGMSKTAAYVFLLGGQTHTCKDKVSCHLKSPS